MIKMKKDERRRNNDKNEKKMKEEKEGIMIEMKIRGKEKKKE